MEKNINTIKLELLPKGAFVIQLENEQYVKGRFSMYALHRFCDAKKIESFFLLLNKINFGMTLGDYADLIAGAIQDYYREDYAQCKWQMAKVMDEIIDPMGGVSSKQFSELIRHAVGRVADLSQPPEGGADTAEGEDNEKKSQQTALTTEEPA